jgi:hypothetical protein
MKKYLIGSISGNYNTSNVNAWIETSNSFTDVNRILFLYNDTNEELKSFCIDKGIELVIPDFDLYGNRLTEFVANSAYLSPDNSHRMVHHIRFLHYSLFLKNLEQDDMVILTDVNDVKFNKNPFDHNLFTSHNGIIATSEEITFEKESWNFDCLKSTFGIFALDDIKNKTINCAGVIAGSAGILSRLCADIYLLCLGKSRNADQVAFNYLINGSYRNNTTFSNLDDNFTVHLHVIANGLVDFDLNKMDEYAIIHQYDRL